MGDIPPWLSAVLGVFGGGGAVVAFFKASAKKASAREESATAVVPDLREMITELREEAKGARAEAAAVRGEMESAIQTAVQASDERCKQLRAQDREECREETLEAVERATAPLRSALVSLAQEAADRRRRLVGRDDTGVQILDEITHRVSKSDPAMRAEDDTVPETPAAIAKLPIARREIPPPKKRDGR